MRARKRHRGTLKDAEQTTRDYNQHGLRILGRQEPEFGVAGRFRDCASDGRQAHQQGIPRSMSWHCRRVGVRGKVDELLADLYVSGRASMSLA
jgi:hypothetical protein